MQYRNDPRARWRMPALAFVLAAGVGLTAHAATFYPTGVRAFAYQPRIGAPGAYIKVTWNRPEHVPSSLVLGSTIWRSDSQGGFQIVGGQDGDTNRAFLDTEASRTFFAYDGQPNSDAGSRTQFTLSGITPGQQYSYQVSTAYRSGLQDKNGDGQPDNTEYMTPLSARSRTVTALSAPLIVSINGQSTQAGSGGAPQVEPHSVEITWQQTPGANAYVVWASSDSTFRKGRRAVSGTIGSVPVDLGGPQTMSATVDVSRAKLKSRSGLVYLTVGAWNSADRVRPQPFGAIFSPPVAVQPEATPPPPPSGG